MPSVSRKQRKFFGMVSAMQAGKKIKGASAELKEAAKTIPEETVNEFSTTPEKGLPVKKKKKFVPVHKGDTFKMRGKA